MESNKGQRNEKASKKAGCTASGIGCALGVTWKKGDGLEGFQGIYVLDTWLSPESGIETVLERKWDN